MRKTPSVAKLGLNPPPLMGISWTVQDLISIHINYGLANLGVEVGYVTGADLLIMGKGCILVPTFQVTKGDSQLHTCRIYNIRIRI